MDVIVGAEDLPRGKEPVARMQNIKPPTTQYRNYDTKNMYDF